MDCDTLRDIVRKGCVLLGAVAKETPAEWDDQVIDAISRGVESPIAWTVICGILKNRLHLLSAAPGQVNNTPLTNEEIASLTMAFEGLDGGKPAFFNPTIIIMAIQALIPIVQQIIKWRNEHATPMPEPAPGPTV